MQVLHCNNIPWTGFPANQTLDHINTCFPKTKYNTVKASFTSRTPRSTKPTVSWFWTCFVDGNSLGIPALLNVVPSSSDIRPKINRLWISRQQSKLCQDLADMLAGGVNVLAHSGDTQLPLKQ
jgi:hypothetical protein